MRTYKIKAILLAISMLLSLSAWSQTIQPSNNLIIDHRDIKLYLDDDTSAMISRHAVRYQDIKLLKSDARCDCWFVDTYKGVKRATYEKAYKRSGYDKGHLTPSHITTYDTAINRFSFSYFNQAPQLPYFNRRTWENLEEKTERLIDSTRQDAVVITGVIYNNNKKEYLKTSRIKIPTHYYKIVAIGGKTWIWIADNSRDESRCVPRPTTLLDLNNLFVRNGMRVRIK